MNGFRFVRRRCNLSLTDVASVLGVSRQAVSFWENGKKEIPLKRKKELGKYFGIDPEYFGEITEDDRQLLLEKAMFRYELNGKEIYRYNHEEDVDKVYFLPDREEPLDEKAFRARKRKKDTIRAIEQMIDSGASSGIEEMSNIIHLGCREYEYTTKLLEKVRTQPFLHKAPMRLELENVWLAMEFAYGVMDEENIKNEAMINPYLDMDFIRNLSDALKKHWNEKVKDLDVPDRLKTDCRLIPIENTGPENPEKSLEERIREAEEDYKRMETKPCGTMVYFL